MDVLRAAGVRPVARATAAGLAAALLALFVLLRGLIGVLDPVEPEVTQVGAGLLVVFIAASLGGVTGAWQAALAGAGNRREIVLVGAAGPGAVCALVSLTLSIANSVDPARALFELVAIATGALAGAWLLPNVALILSRLRGQSGQTAAEYMGALLLVAVIVAALITVVPKIADRSTAAVDASAAGNGIPSTSYGDDQRSPTPVDPNADDDGGGLVKGLAKILGAGGKSAATALKGALEDLPATLRLRLASSGLLKGVEGLFYDTARNEFAIQRPDGILRTYFKPKDGWDYWLEQLAKG